VGGHDKRSNYVADEFVVMCIAASDVQVQTRPCAGVWSQFELEVSELLERHLSQVTRNNWSKKNFHEIVESSTCTCKVLFTFLLSAEDRNYEIPIDYRYLRNCVGVSQLSVLIWNTVLQGEAQNASKVGART